MMLAHPALDTPLCFEKQPVQVLCVENKALFREMLCCLFSGNDPARFVLSENLTPLDFAKNAFFLRDLLFPDFSDKALSRRIDALAESLLHTDTPEALAELARAVAVFQNQVCAALDFDVESAFDPTPHNLIKLLALRPRTQGFESPQERLVFFCAVLKKYTHCKLFLAHDLFSYFSHAEALRLFDALAQHGIAFLTIESCAVKRDAEFGLYIIDRDLCCIHESG